MITPRPSHERGHADHGWLRARHTFSFARYVDRRYAGYSALCVLNDDVITPGGGFGMHPHSDMEIVTYVLDGALEHQDSLGNGSVIRAGDVQYISAGTGVLHSEFNPSDSEPVHLLQIWILPERNGAAPCYGQKHIPAEEKRGRWRGIVSPDGRDDTLAIRQNASILATRLDGDAPLHYRPEPGRRQYLHLARGSASLNGILLNEGDGAFVENETLLTLSDAEGAEALLFDLP